jgi:hypothetical protein
MPITVYGTTEIKFKNDVYLLKKGKELKIFEEVSEPEEAQITEDFSEFFENYKRWKFGIKTEKWTMVFVTAINFKFPHLVWDESVNFLLSITSKNGKYNITGIIFDKDERTALEKAFLFKKLNLSYISFDISGEYSPYPLEIKKEQLFTLISGILKELKEIKQIAKETYSETKSIKEETKSIKEISLGMFNLMGEMVKELRFLRKDMQELAKRLEAVEKHFNVSREQTILTTNSITASPSAVSPPHDAIEVVVVSDKAVNQSGETVKLPNPLEEVVEFIYPKTEAFLMFFGYDRGLKEEVEPKLAKLVREKYLRGESDIFPEEAKEITGIEPKIKRPWKIVITLKQDYLRKLVKAVKETLGYVPLSEVEKALKCVFKEVIEKNLKSVDGELLKRCFAEKYRPRVEALLKKLENIKEGKVEADGKIYIPKDELLLLSLDLEAKRKGKKLLVREI